MGWIKHSIKVKVKQTTLTPKLNLRTDGIALHDGKNATRYSPKGTLIIYFHAV